MNTPVRGFAMYPAEIREEENYRVLRRDVPLTPLTIYGNSFGGGLTGAGSPVMATGNHYRVALDEADFIRARSASFSYARPVPQVRQTWSPKQGSGI